MKVEPRPTEGEGSGEEGVKAAEAGFVSRGRASFTTMLREAANYRELTRTPYKLTPIIIFVLIGAVSSFDAAIFGLARPEILLEFDLGQRDIGLLISTLQLLGFFVIFVSLAFAFLADRVKRVPLLAMGTILQGVFSLFTTRATNLWSLVFTRGAEGASSNLTSIPAGSLQADYYPPESRGKAFALSGVMARVMTLAAPLTVAFVVTNYGWRTPYYVTGALLVILGVVAFLVLREPIRGYMERKALGLSEEEASQPEDRVSFGEAWRTIWGIRTLRRLFISDIPAYMADYVYALIWPLFLFESYGLNITERAVLGTVVLVFVIPFGFFSGGMVDVLTRRRPQRVLIFTGLLNMAGAVFIFAASRILPIWALGLSFALFGAASALIGPARGVLFAQIIPAHVRSLGLVVRVLAAVPGAMLNFFIIGYVLPRYGFPGMIAASAPLYLVSALIEMSAAGFFEGDMRASLASQAASQEWRRAKEAGRGKLLVSRDIDVEYDGVQVLFGVDFDAEEGEIIALLGTNGAGKSTLLKAISGVQEASSGAVVFDGRDITHMPPHEIASRGVSLMPGGRGIFPALTVRENLELATWKIDEKEARTKMAEIYRIFPILKERSGERANLLSGGEQQMLSLGQAFLSSPRLLMIDELSLGLSPAIVQQLIEIVKAIHAEGTTIILVEQSVNVALTVAERAIFMEKGEVKFVGQTRDLLSRPDILRAVYVKGVGALTEGAPAAAMKTDKDLRRYELEEARLILQVQNVSKSFGGIKAVEDVSLDLKEGEILGLLGPNGAGKTTLFDLITGYQIPDSGRIFLDGVDITTMPADQRARLRLIRRFQDARLFPSLTVYENILVALERRIDVRSMALTALQLPQVRQSERRARRRADRLVELLELGAYRDKFAKELSTGLRRITDLACVLATEPRVLLLDEPSTGIAQAEAEMLAPLLRRVRFETGCSMLIIEHDMPLIASLSDELVAMDQGRVVTRGLPEDVLNNEFVIESYLGTKEEVIRRQGTTE